MYSFPTRRSSDLEDDEEDEDVVDGKRPLDEVASQELESAICAELPVDPAVEEEGEHDPDDVPSEGLAEAHLVGAAVEDTEVERKEGEHEQGEADPEARRSDAWEVHHGLTPPAAALRLAGPLGWQTGIAAAAIGR